MSLEKLYGNRTFGGRFLWETTYIENEWKIQHHKTRVLSRESKPYRLLDPENHLIASADSEEELKEYLEHIVEH